MNAQVGLVLVVGVLLALCAPGAHAQGVFAAHVDGTRAQYDAAGGDTAFLTDFAATAGVSAGALDVLGARDTVEGGLVAAVHAAAGGVFDAVATRVAAGAFDDTTVGGLTVLSVEVAAPPSAPRALHVVAAELTNVTVAWSAPAERAHLVDAYRVDDATLGTMWTDTHTVATLAGLDEATKYDLTVVAQSLFGDSVASSVVSVRTDDYVTPAMVEDVEAVATTHTSITVGWAVADARGRDVLHYDIEVAQNGPSSVPSHEWEEFSVAGDVTELRVRELRALTEYRVRVRAVSDQGEGPWSEVVVMETSRAPVGDDDDDDDSGKTKGMVAVCVVTGVALVGAAVFAYIRRVEGDKVSDRTRWFSFAFNSLSLFGVVMVIVFAVGFYD